MTKDVAGAGPHGPVGEHFMRHYYGPTKGTKTACPHQMCFKGSHPSFQKGLWLCVDCGEQVDLEGLVGYAVVLAAVRMEQ